MRRYHCVIMHSAVAEGDRRRGGGGGGDKQGGEGNILRSKCKGSYCSLHYQQKLAFIA